MPILYKNTLLLQPAYLGGLLDHKTDLVGVLARHLQLDALGVRHFEL